MVTNEDPEEKLKTARKILGKSVKNMSDSKFSIHVAKLDHFADMIFKMWLEDLKKKKVKSLVKRRLKNIK